MVLVGQATTIATAAVVDLHCHHHTLFPLFWCSSFFKVKCLFKFGFLSKRIEHQGLNHFNPSITVVLLPVRATRCPSKYSFIWNLPENHKIELPLTSSNQPIQKAGRHFSGWLGTIARKPHLCPIKYKNWTEMQDELKEEIWDIVQSKWILPEEPARLEATKNRTLSSIATYWRNHKSTLKKKYFLGRGNRARAPPNVIQEDYEAIVQHWSLPKTRVTTLGKPVERADVYVKLHLHKDGTPVNAEAQSNIEKINELLSESSNRVQSSDLTGSISWAPDDVYAQVFGNERNGRVRGVGFGPTPSMHPAKSTPAIAQCKINKIILQKLVGVVSV
ncbi:hypothetical protein CMV_009906 [Castanea mollissima]|uniref:Transposase n=1 Tax=Castanea mollissima TaxID=60419 RepID=A0A8J4RK60_9ROSI|nr:hypothetical protein CMV_009906 [Castanea mollissima]